MASVATTLIAALAGYYVGKSSGMRRSETISTLKETAKSSPARDDEFRPPQSLSSSVEDLGQGGESDSDSEDEEDAAAAGEMKSFEDLKENNCKMV